MTEMSAKQVHIEKQPENIGSQQFRKKGDRSFNSDLLDSLNSHGLCILTYHTPVLPWILGLSSTAV